LTRLLTCLAVVSSLAVASVVFASCDTGGEPPLPDGGTGTTTPDAPTETGLTDGGGEGEGSPVDGTSTGDGTGTDDGEGGGVSDAGCPAACATTEECVNGTCVACGAEAGEPCCSASGQASSTCGGTGSLVCGDAGFCETCGGPGEACCGLNTCDDGGCCVSQSGVPTCAAQGDSCKGIDGGTCQAGQCGGASGCGGPGQSCCETWCTAPETVCQGSSSVTQGGDSSSTTTVVPGQCHACGTGGASCCAGSTCAGSLSCNSSGLCVK
jgi:hypothetical protein